MVEQKKKKMDISEENYLQFRETMNKSVIRDTKSKKHEEESWMLLFMIFSCT